MTIKTIQGKITNLDSRVEQLEAENELLKARLDNLDGGSFKK